MVRWNHGQARFLYATLGRVPYIPLRAVGFPLGAIHRDRMYASMPMLQWAAITVGVSATTASVGSRPLAELVWRSALMEASVEQRGARWVKTSAYGRLDASEKSAVSYFLGMAQAQLSCDIFLGIPTLVHLDVYLRSIGRPTRKSRPDFLGYDPVSGAAVAVEAKGRTNGYTDKLVYDAKAQARKLPSLTGASSAAEVASVAWFDNDRVWHALLVDPPRRRQPVEYPALAVVAAHYVRVVESVAANGFEDDGTRVRSYIDPVDLEVSVPTRIFQALGGGGELRVRKLGRRSSLTRLGA